jgi:hypothetical protein
VLASDVLAGAATICGSTPATASAGVAGLTAAQASAIWAGIGSAAMGISGESFVHHGQKASAAPEATS